MAKTGAERQAALRSRRAGQKRRQLNVWISEEFYLAIKKISDEHDLTMSEALECLLNQGQKNLIK